MDVQSIINIFGLYESNINRFYSKLDEMNLWYLIYLREEEYVAQIQLLRYISVFS